MSVAENQALQNERSCSGDRLAIVPPLFVFIVLNLALAMAVFLAFVLSVDHWSVPVVMISLLVLINAIWISGGAATAIFGLLSPAQRSVYAPEGWEPAGKTAVLITVCGEDPLPLANYLSGFAKGLSTIGLAAATKIFVISDTFGTEKIKDELQALSPLIDAGLVAYRRRNTNTNKKPGNIADWLHSHGDEFDYMVVKDADSRMTASSIREMIWRLERNPKTGLLQAGIALVPGRTRFGRYQRISSRLLSRNFGRGFAAWSGTTANYWGHNAIMRVEAFRTASSLPHLSGSAPFGGAILSHDFVEAAWMRRAGWHIELAPDIKGSAEDAPQTLTEFFRRDRRWCQGNLQHLRVVTQPGLHAISRFHLVTGIFSYLAAPIWLLLLVFLSSGVVSVSGYAPVALVAAVLLVPKICALIDMLPRTRTWHGRGIILKAWLSELALSALVAPLILFRQALSVFSVLLGRDCGWKSAKQPRWKLPGGWTEGLVGLCILGIAMTSSMAVALWLAAIFVPLISAPALIAILNRRVR